MASIHNTTEKSSDNLLSYLQTTIVSHILSIGGEGWQMQCRYLSTSLWDILTCDL